MNKQRPSEQLHSSFAGWIGVARADITPPIGVYARNWRAAKHDVADSIHRPLFARLRARDLPDPTPGSKRVICGYNPSVHADDTLLVGRVADRSGEVRATLVNYACHPTTLAWENTAISPDFVGAMRETVEAVTRGPAMFLQGASGELAPRRQYVGDHKVADQHGRQLGFAALATLEDMEPPATKLVFDQVVESGAPLAVWRHEAAVSPTALEAIEMAVELPLKNWPTADELERKRLACTDRVEHERLRRMRDKRRDLGDRATYRLPMWTWRIGDAVLVGSPAEAYSQLQREIRRRFPSFAVVCLNVVNGSAGYLPPADLYDRDIYQVVRTPFDRGSLELTIEAMTRTVSEIMSQDSASDSHESGMAENGE